MEEKTLSPNELVEMPSSNLAETIHNKWLQASSNKGGNLYIVAVDDYIRAFLQVVAYYQYLKRGVGRLGPNKKELRLNCAQCRAEPIGNPGVLQKALFDMLWTDEFCIHDAHHEGAEVFGSQKQKPNRPIGADNKTHRPNTITQSISLASF